MLHLVGQYGLPVHHVKVNDGKLHLSVFCIFYTGKIFSGKKARTNIRFLLLGLASFPALGFASGWERSHPSE